MDFGIALAIASGFGALICLGWFIATMVNHDPPRHTIGAGVCTTIFSLILLLGLNVACKGFFYWQDQRIQEKKTQIEIMETREKELREALIPLVKKYVRYESGLIEALKTRSTQQFLALLERYPELKANENFMKLMDNIVELRDKVVEAKLAYNQIAQSYNTKTRVWPTKFFVPKDLAKQVEFVK